MNRNSSKVILFADGIKISFERAIVGNAMGKKIAKRGMIGPNVKAGPHLKEVLQDLYPEEFIQENPGIVDYVVGAKPSPGLFIIAKNDDPKQKHYLDLFKVGKGPY